MVSRALPLPPRHPPCSRAAEISCGTRPGDKTPAGYYSPACTESPPQCLSPSRRKTSFLRHADAAGWSRGIPPSARRGSRTGIPSRCPSERCSTPTEWCRALRKTGGSAASHHDRGSFPTRQRFGEQRHLYHADARGWSGMVSPSARLVIRFGTSPELRDDRESPSGKWFLPLRKTLRFTIRLCDGGSFTDRQFLGKQGYLYHADAKPRHDELPKPVGFLRLRWGAERRFRAALCGIPPLASFRRRELPETALSQSKTCTRHKEMYVDSLPPHRQLAPAGQMRGICPTALTPRCARTLNGTVGRLDSLPPHRQLAPTGQMRRICPTDLPAVGRFVRGTKYDVLVSARCAGICGAEGGAEP